MEPMAIISVDGHVTGSREEFRNCVERKYLEAYDDWSKSLDEIGIETLGNLKPELGAASQWVSDRRRGTSSGAQARHCL
jgi:hypothetical protein